jgi:hypothetical protein
LADHLCAFTPDTQQASRRGSPDEDLSQHIPFAAWIPGCTKV